MCACWASNCRLGSRATLANTPISATSADAVCSAASKSLRTGKQDPVRSGPKLHARIKNEAMRRGLMGYPMGGTVDGRLGDHVLLAPPYICSLAEIDQSWSGSAERSTPSSPPIDAPCVRSRVAPNGARKTRQDHPALPITPQRAGATAPPPAGMPAPACSISMSATPRAGTAWRHRTIGPAVDAVRRAVGRSLVLQLTSEAVGIYAPAEQRAMVRELRPEAVSLALREILPDAASEPEGAGFLAWAHREADRGPVHSLRRRRCGTLRRAAPAAGVIPEGRHWVLFVLGRYTRRAALQPRRSPPHARRLAGGRRDHRRRRLGRPAHSARGRSNAAPGYRRPRGTCANRGFENNLLLPDGRTARDNAELPWAASPSSPGNSAIPWPMPDQLRALFA